MMRMVLMSFVMPSRAKYSAWTGIIRVSGRQGVDGDEAERRRAVYEDIVVKRGYRFEEVGEHLFAAGAVDELYFCACEVDA